MPIRCANEIIIELNKEALCDIMLLIEGIYRKGEFDMSKKKKSGYGKPYGKKPYLKKSEKKILLGILTALAVLVAGYFIITSFLDDSLKVRNGKVVTGAGDWIIVNEGTSSDRKYYKYCSYDFSPLDAEIEVTHFTADQNLANVYVRPIDGSYSYACVYGSSLSNEALADSMYPQLSAMISQGEIGEMKDRTFNGIDAKTCWYSTYTIQMDEEGNAILDENGDEYRSYTQIFFCYLQSARDGSIVIRLGYEPQNDSDYLDEETGFGYIADIIDCLTIYEHD